MFVLVFRTILQHIDLDLDRHQVRMAGQTQTQSQRMQDLDLDLEQEDLDLDLLEFRFLQPEQNQDLGMLFKVCNMRPTNRETPGYRK